MHFSTHFVNRCKYMYMLHGYALNNSTRISINKYHNQVYGPDFVKHHVKPGIVMKKRYFAFASSSRYGYHIM